MAFDPYDKNSWYFGPMGRKEAEEVLKLEDELGVFLVRDSTTIQGDLVLCVKEDTKISHYIINKIRSSVPNDTLRNGSSQTSSSPIRLSSSPSLATTTKVKFRIGDMYFSDIPALLTFYKSTELDTTRLTRPVKKAQKVIALFDFAGHDHGDLPFVKDEILTIVNKHEEQWWMAKNSSGIIGCIPVPYVTAYESLQWSSSFDGSSTSLASSLASSLPSEGNTPLVSSNGMLLNNNNNNNDHFVSQINTRDLINHFDSGTNGVVHLRSSLSDHSSHNSSDTLVNGDIQIHNVQSPATNGSGKLSPSLANGKSNSPLRHPSNGNISGKNSLSGCPMVVNASSIDADAPVSDVPELSSSANCISSKLSTLHLNDPNSHGESVKEVSSLTATTGASTLNSRGPPPPLPASHSRVKDVPSPASSLSSLGSHGSSSFPSTCISSTTSTLPCSIASSSTAAGAGVNSATSSSSSGVASASIHSTSSPSSLHCNTSLSTATTTANAAAAATTTSVHGCTSNSTYANDAPPYRTLNIEGRTLPALARVIQKHTPNAYDRTALKLEVRLHSLLLFFFFLFNVLLLRSSVTTLEFYHSLDIASGKISTSDGQTAKLFPFQGLICYLIPTYISLSLEAHDLHLPVVNTNWFTLL